MLFKLHMILSPACAWKRWVIAIYRDDSQIWLYDIYEILE